MFAISIKMLKEISHLKFIDIHFDDIIDKYILAEAAKMNTILLFQKILRRKRITEKLGVYNNSNL